MVGIGTCNSESLQEEVGVLERCLTMGGIGTCKAASLLEEVGVLERCLTDRRYNLVY